ncbi:hypothetical protein [Chitinophaga tropicalis]|uniref:Uncharacterized protein n=1 Tax=Chitinophaga tropicalis TaxID=2683588 RepID=A0A7K1U0T2_9BACT|nr:hypothetical protein [Chitinophaga tropicalis]MVT07972.1 hypothetical protein [Chitinophaga tropicalis]
MKANTKYIWLILPVLAIAGTVAAFAGIPALREAFTGKPPVTAPNLTGSATDIKQQAILKELTTVLHAMDSMYAGTVTGTISARDLADSSNTLQADFCYTRSNDIGYYRFGDNEMISLKEAYITIAHDVKKIFLSAPREVVNPMKMPLDIEAEVIRKEGYQVQRTSKGPLTEISLLSPTHATCREYRLSFDSTGMIRYSHARLTDPSNPEIKERDRILDVTIHSWEKGKVREDLLKIERYINLENGAPQPAAALKGYELLISKD